MTINSPNTKSRIKDTDKKNPTIFFDENMNQN